MSQKNLKKSRNEVINKEKDNKIAHSVNLAPGYNYSEIENGNYKKAARSILLRAGAL